MLAVTLALALSVCGLYMFFESRSLTRDIGDASHELALVRQRTQGTDALRGEWDYLVSQANTLESLREPLPTASLLALLSQVMPEETAAQRIQIETVATPEPRELRRGRPIDSPRVEIAGTRIQLEGIALSSTAVAHLMKQLANANAFEDLRLVDNRETVVNGRACQSFRIAMEVAGARPWPGLLPEEDAP